MMCDHCEKEKASALPRSTRKGEKEWHGKQLCASCCIALFPADRAWMTDAAARESGQRAES